VWGCVGGVGGDVFWGVGGWWVGVGGGGGNGQSESAAPTST